MTQYYFAWVDNTATTWDAAFAREDEPIFSYSLTQEEGGFASLTIVVRNPKVGLLKPTRKIWAWFSAAFASAPDTVVPLFFGRVAGMPADVAGEAVTFTLHARPEAYSDLKDAAAEALKVAPYWDPIWITPDAAEDPDSVLEARSALWHIDRTTHAITVSDLLEGEDGTINLDGDVFRDSVDFSFGSPPVHRIHCEATVGWEQTVKGRLDITRNIQKAFKTAGTGSDFLATSFTGSGLMDDWPKRGAQMEGNWSFGPTSVERIGGIRVNDAKETTDDFNPFDDFPDVDVDIGPGDVTAEWPLWKIKHHTEIRYRAHRTYNEKVRFTVTADTQHFITNPDESKRLKLSLSSDLVGEPVDPDDALPIVHRRRRAFFPTTRGIAAITYLLSVCRARLRANCRCVEIKGETYIEQGAAFSCRKNIRIISDQLPGGTATGKIKSYEMSMDDGEEKTSFVIGCSIGKGNTVSATAGTPDYVDASYVATGYQTYSGASAEVFAGTLTLDDFSSIAPNDDGLIFRDLLPRDVINDITVYNGEDDQRTLIGHVSGTTEETAAALDKAPTIVDLNLKPISEGPFHTFYPLTVSKLTLPKTIDLAAT